MKNKERFNITNPNVDATSKTEKIKINEEVEAVSDLKEKMADDIDKETLKIVQVIETSSLPNEEKKKLKNRIASNLKKMLRIFSFATALTGAAGMVAGVASHQSGRYNVESKIVTNGQVEYTHEYTHEDKETTHILNVLSGKEELSDLDKRDILVDYLSNTSDNLQFEGKQEDLNVMSLDELYKIADSARTVLDNNSTRFISREERLDRILINPGPNKFDPELYNALWQLEKECGNPKVRFRLAEKKNILGFGDIIGRSFYRPDTNTIYIDMSNNSQSIDHYISELSHAQQFSKKPVHSTFRALGDLSNVIKEIVFGDEEEIDDQTHWIIKTERSQGKLYEHPGTLEHDAHSVIEPELWKKFDNLTPARSEKDKNNRKIEDQILEEVKKLDEQKEQELSKLFQVYMGKKFTVAQEAKSALDAVYAEDIKRIQEKYKNKKEVFIFKLRDGR